MFSIDKTQKYEKYMSASQRKVIREKQRLA